MYLRIPGMNLRKNEFQKMPGLSLEIVTLHVPEHTKNESQKMPRLSLEIVALLVPENPKNESQKMPGLFLEVVALHVPKMCQRISGMNLRKCQDFPWKLLLSIYLRIPWMILRKCQDFPGKSSLHFLRAWCQCDLPSQV